ncbi:hypothetical protein AB1N83_008904 [Pleurotus pulmonarius]
MMNRRCSTLCWGIRKTMEEADDIVLAGRSSVAIELAGELEDMQPICLFLIHLLCYVYLNTHSQNQDIKVSSRSGAKSRIMSTISQPTVSPAWRRVPARQSGQCLCRSLSRGKSSRKKVMLYKGSSTIGKGHGVAYMGPWSTKYT